MMKAEGFLFTKCLSLQWAVLLPVVLTLVGTQRGSNGVVKFLAQLCYPKWALEAFVIANAERYVILCGKIIKLRVCLVTKVL